MTGILARYITSQSAGAMLRVSLVLVGLYVSVDLVREAADLGEGYGVPEMLLYLLRTAPARLYDLFPFAILIGGVIALGRLNASQEAVAMRACGFHRWRIVSHSLAAALVLVGLVMAAGEWLVPALETQARIERERARTGQVGMAPGQQLWVRDGPFMIRAGLLIQNDFEQVGFTGLRFYELDADGQLQRLILASGASHRNGFWHLFEARRLDLKSGSLSAAESEFIVQSELSPDVFRALATRPRLLPLSDIIEIRRYLEANELDASAYAQAFWRRLLYPLNALAMLIAGASFVFKSSRTVAPVIGVFIGVSIGIGFVLVNRIVIGLAPIVPVPMGLIHMVPSVVFAILGSVLLRRA
ncbi:MAG: LPS export ABC transporter permease LptG [Xanthomonadaceae bacterium]|nr:LPS export ABC transporter permease LptG [Xanthomonadaceae bacterium]